MNGWVSQLSCFFLRPTILFVCNLFHTDLSFSLACVRFSFVVGWQNREPMRNSLRGGRSDEQIIELGSED